MTGTGLCCWTRCRGLAQLTILIALIGGDALVAARAAELYPLGIGSRTIVAEIALTPAQTSRGLMFRRHLPENQGMLFIFARPRQLAFWMRNTSIPLDIGYLDASGELREIYPLQPRDERPVRSRGTDMRYALEVNRGWYERQGVKVGSRLNLDDVARALRQLDQDP